MTARSFHLGDVLSATTGRLVSPRHIAGVYDILDWMTGDSLFTHQLPRACGVCGPALLAQHPQLADVRVPDGLSGEDAVQAWLTEQAAIHGEHLDVIPLPPGEWQSRDPIAELAEMVGPERVTVVGIGDPPAPGGAQ